MNARFTALVTALDGRFTTLDGRFTGVDKRIDDLRADTTRGFRTLTLMMGICFTLLTLLTILFKFIR